MPAPPPPPKPPLPPVAALSTPSEEAPPLPPPCVIICALAPEAVRTTNNGTAVSAVLAISTARSNVRRIFLLAPAFESHLTEHIQCERFGSNATARRQSVIGSRTFYGFPIG